MHSGAVEGGRQSAAGSSEGIIAVLRSQALARFKSLPALSSRDELWRYTHPEKFSISSLSQATPCEVVVEGFDKKSDRINGIEISPFQSLNEDGKAIVRRLLDENGADLISDPVAQLQLSCMSGGFFIRVQKGVDVVEPIRLRTIVKKAQPSAVVASVVVIVVPTGSSVSIVDDVSGDAALVAPRIEVLAESGSRVNFCSIQDLSRNAQYLARHRFHLTRDVTADLTYVSVGAKVARVDLDCRMLQPGSSATIRALYSVDDDRHFDFHPSQIHVAPHCYSNLTAKGALKDSGRAVYYGYIRVREGAQKTDAYQKNKNLILSQTARVDSIPNLEILANDVKCSHGSSIGELNSDELFYLRSRGLSAEQAERLLLEGFFDELLSSIASDSIREACHHKLIDRKGSHDGD